MQHHLLEIKFFFLMRHSTTTTPWCATANWSVTQHNVSCLIGYQISIYFMYGVCVGERHIYCCSEEYIPTAKRYLHVWCPRSGRSLPGLCILISFRARRSPVVAHITRLSCLQIIPMKQGGARWRRCLFTWTYSMYVYAEIQYGFSKRIPR